MNRTIDLAKLTNGKLTGELEVTAYGWETRYSWGHTAEVYKDFNLITRAKIRYYNRTWEVYRFQTAIHEALYKYVYAVTGIAPLKPLCKRDAKPMKSADAEVRRLARVEAYNFAKDLYGRLTDFVDGKIAYKNVA